MVQCRHTLKVILILDVWRRLCILHYSQSEFLAPFPAEYGSKPLRPKQTAYL